MPNIDLSILNQRQTPAFYADVFANRPAAGFVGRIFISTNTFAFYRDNGTSWDLIGGPGTGTVTGTGANGQVTFWNGASTITGSNDLFWDATNGHLGVNTNAPGTALDVHHDQPTVAILNQTVATNDTRIGFQNNGVGLWRIGNFYNLGSNDYAVNDAVLNINRFTIKSSSGQTFVGDATTSSGLFVVNNSSGDAHIVALGATAPSIRVRNAGVGATLQFGLGLATTTNNFIQGSTGGEFCIFNDSLTAQPILFGIKDAGLGNTQEAARISAARNFLIGTTTDSGYKLNVNGTGLFSGNLTSNATIQSTNGTVTTILSIGTGIGSVGTNSNHPLVLVANASEMARLLPTTGAFSVGGVGSPVGTLHVGNANSAVIINESSSIPQIIGTNRAASASAELFIKGFPLSFTGNGGGGAVQVQLPSTGNLLIGTTTDNGTKVQINGGVQSTNIIASSNLSYNRVGFTMVPSVDNATFTLQGTFPNIVFSNQFIAMRLLIMGTDTTNATSTIVNCVRDSGTTWATTIVNSTSVGSTLTPVITFGGTSAAPTMQITGAILNSVVIEIITR